jgi:hypothetical protein
MVNRFDRKKEPRPHIASTPREVGVPPITTSGALSVLYASRGWMPRNLEVEVISVPKTDFTGTTAF